MVPVPPAAAGPEPVEVPLDVFGILLLSAFGAAELAAFAVPWAYRALFAAHAPGGRIDAALLQAIAWQESGFDPQVISAPNANGTRDYGLMQINETNFAAYGLTPTSALDPERSIAAAVQELAKHAPQAGSVADLVSMYNAGEAPGGGPRKTAAGLYVDQAYVRDTLGRYVLYRVAEFAPVKRLGA